MNIEFAHLMPSVASILLGEPNKKLSKKHELRYGTKGSLAVDLKKGTFFDHEIKEGGGVLDLIKREGHANPIDWLREQRLIQDDTIVATFPYRDETGKLLFQVCRTATKGFFQRRPNGSGELDKQYTRRATRSLSATRIDCQTPVRVRYSSQRAKSTLT